MHLKLRFWDTSVPASDGSRIPLSVFEEYFNSPQCKDALESKSMLCSLTHRSRNLKTAPSDYQGLKGTVGSDDMLLCVDHNTPSPVMYITRLYYDRDTQWVCADAKVIPEDGADEDMAKQIKRLKTLLHEGIKPGVSAVVVGLWDSNSGMGGDICRKINQIKAIDITLNPSQKGARVTDIYEDEEGKAEIDIEVVKKPKSLPSYFRTFSDTDIKIMNSGQAVTKTFSTDEYAAGLPKTSKVGLRFTTLKVKEFSVMTPIDVVDEDSDKKMFSVGTLKERLRMNKLSPRQSFRRLVLDYRQLCKSQGGASKMNPEDLRVLKSLFTSDVLMILREIHPDILKGKQISTLLGASSLGKNTRLAAQKLQIPYKLASKEVEKSGMLSKPRFQKLQDSYQEFINSMIDEVFNNNSMIPSSQKKEEETEEDINEKED